MSRLTELLSRLLAGAAATLLAALVFLAAAETLAWFFLRRSWAWAGEVAGVLMVWFGLLAAAWVLRLGLHIRLEVVADRFPGRVQGAVRRFAALMVALFGVLLAWYGAALVNAVTNTLPATGWSAAVHYVPAAVAGGFIAVFGLGEAVAGHAGAPVTAENLGDGPSQ